MMRFSHYRKVLSVAQIRNRQFCVKTEIETNLISTEMIKPSSPTPKSLQKLQLSFIDRLAPPVFMPIIYFFSSNTKTPEFQISNHLKKSLSETLSKFYPLAGRFVDNLYVDCNDRGVPFAEAEAHCDLSRVITNPDPERMKKLLLYKLDELESQDLCMCVQATYFRCGGLAVGLLVSHNIADALSMLTFANSWSAVARNGGGDCVASPKFEAATYFPSQKQQYNLGAITLPPPPVEEEIVTRIFTFPAARIAAIQEMFSSSDGDLPGRRRRSRVASLMAYIWRWLVLGADDPTKTHCVRCAVNIRSLVDPPMSENHFGNIICFTTATSSVGDDVAEIMDKVWEACKPVHDAGWATEAKAMDAMKEYFSHVQAGDRIVSFFFTSICRFPLYEADFGWGKPVWVVVPGFPPKNMAIFSDAKSGGAIEVVLNLSKADMEKFETDLDQAQFLTSNLPTSVAA